MPYILSGKQKKILKTKNLAYLQELKRRIEEFVLVVWKVVLLLLYMFLLFQ